MFLQAEESPCLPTDVCCWFRCSAWDSGTVVLEFWTLTGILMWAGTQGWVSRWHSVAFTEPSSPRASPSFDRKRAAFWRHVEKPSINWCFSLSSSSFAFFATAFCKKRTVYSRISAFSIRLWLGFCKSTRKEDNLDKAQTQIQFREHSCMALNRWAGVRFLRCAQVLAEAKLSGSPDSDSFSLSFAFRPVALTAAGNKREKQR